MIIKLSYFNPVKTFEIDVAHTFSRKSVVEQNLHYLNKSGILVVDLNDLDKSFGTMYELIYAKTVLEIPVLGIGDCEQFTYSPHYNEMITERFNDVEDVMEYISVMYM